MPAPKHTLSLCLFAMLWLTSVCTADTQRDRIKLYFGVAEGNYLIRDFRGAQKTLDQILKIDPRHVPSLRLQTRVQLEQQRPFEALQTTTRLLEIDPNSPEDRLLQSLVLGNLDRRKEGIELLNSLIDQLATDSKHYATATQMLGLFQMAESDWDAAAETFYERYKITENKAQSLELATEAYIEKAQTALEQNNSRAAIEAIEQALALYPQNSGSEALKRRTDLRIMLAQVHSRSGNNESAIATLEPILREQSENRKVRVILASLYASTAQWDTLDAILDPLKKLPQFTDIALYFEGRNAYAQGRIGTARSHFEAALDQIPDGPSKLRPSLLFYKGACLEALQRKEEANQFIIEALETGFQAEQTTEAQLGARIYLRTGDTEKAIEILEAALLTQSDQSSQTWQLLGRAHEVNNSPGLALSAYNQALSIEKPTAETLGLRGALLRKLGDLEGALVDFEKALRIQPDNTALTYSLGLTQFQLGTLREAASQLKLALDQQPNNSDLALLLALIQYTLGQYEPASEHITKAKTSTTQQIIQYLLLARTERELALNELQVSLNENSDPELNNFYQFAKGTISQAEALNRAGIADTPERAQIQICAAAFWMAQQASLANDQSNRKALLEIAVDTERSTSPEFQCALWQLKQF